MPPRKEKASTSMLEHALAYARAGLPVIPLHGVLKDGSCTCGVARCPSPGKHPRTKNGLQDATTDEKTIRRWWSAKRWPKASIGGVGGEFICLDIDARKGGIDSLQRLIKANAKLPDTAIAETGEYDGERGLHYWFKVPEDESPATRTNIREGIDIRCTGGYAVMPPSPHASGVSYEWISRRTIKGAATCPDWVLELVPEYVEGESTWTPNPNFRMSKQVRDFLKGDYLPDIGEQREFLLQAARSVLTTGRTVEMTSSLLWEGEDGNGGINACDWRDGEPWTPEDIYAIVSDIFAKPPTTPMEKDFDVEDHSLDDAGNAERLLASFGDVPVHHCGEIGKWFVWDDEDKRYRGDDGSWMRMRWIEVAAELNAKAMRARSESEAKALLKHAREARMKPRIEAAVSLAQLYAKVPESELDKDPFLLAVNNGVVDLRSGELEEATPEVLLTRRAPVAFDPEAQSDLFDEFLERVVPDDDLRAFLQRACGYSLTGSTAEHMFFYIYGRPASGKTTFLEAFKHVMGSYAMTADTATFLREAQRSRNGGAPSEDLARLAGARLVVTHEVEKGERMAESLVSKFVGGDSVSARFLHGSTFEFKPRFKLWIGANHLPRVTGSTRSGIWRRVNVIPLDESIPKEERDPTLPRKLREPETLEAILAWAVAGAQEWHATHRKGAAMLVPDVVEAEVEKYAKESDHVNLFVEEALKVTGKNDDRVAKTDLFKHYLGWCDSVGREIRETSYSLSPKLSDLGLEHKMARVNGKTARCWIGVELKDVATAGIKVKGATSNGKRSKPRKSVASRKKKRSARPKTRSKE